MTNKERIERVDAAWQKRAEQEKKPVAIVKAIPRNCRAEKIRGIQI